MGRRENTVTSSEDVGKRKVSYRLGFTAHRIGDVTEEDKLKPLSHSVFPATSIEGVDTVKHVNNRDVEMDSKSDEEENDAVMEDVDEGSEGGQHKDIDKGPKTSNEDGEESRKSYDSANDLTEVSEARSKKSESKTVPTKGKGRGRPPAKPKMPANSTEGDESSSAVKIETKPKTPRKRKTPVSSNEDGEEKKTPTKRGRKTKKEDPEDAADAAAASHAACMAIHTASQKAALQELAVKREKYKTIPWFREEMTEIFDYLCDRGVYWKNDLPRNKKFSFRDTKALEREVRRVIRGVLEGYPEEKDVMEAFNERVEKLEGGEGEKIVIIGKVDSDEDVDMPEAGEEVDALGEKAKGWKNIEG